MLDDFLIRAILMLLMLSCLTAPLGSIAIWRRMSYFGDATSHAALFGVSISLVFGVSPIWGSILLAVIVGWVLGSIDERKQSSDALLGVLAHGGLAGALVVTALSSERRGNLEGFLFGDILNTSGSDLIQMLFIGGVLLIVVIYRWKNFILSTLNPELASAQGVNPRFETRIYVLILAICVALAMKAVGALLVGALLIIPALCARRFANSPESMVGIAVFVTWLASLGGFWASYEFDLPTGATIVLANVFILCLSNLYKSS